MAETITTQNVHPQEGPVDLTKRVTLYAPKGLKHYKEGQEVTPGAALEAKFKALGFTDKAPAKK